MLCFEGNKYIKTPLNMQKWYIWFDFFMKILLRQVVVKPQ